MQIEIRLRPFRHFLAFLGPQVLHRSFLQSEDTGRLPPRTAAKRRGTTVAQDPPPAKRGRGRPKLNPGQDPAHRAPLASSAVVAASTAHLGGQAAPTTR